MIYFSVYDTSIMMGFVLLISSIVVENIWILHDESLWIACSVHTLVKKTYFRSWRNLLNSSDRDA